MKNTALAITLISALLALSLIVTVQVVRVSEADPMPLLSPPPSLIISIETPIGGGRYSQDYVSLVLNVEIPRYPGFNFGYPHGDMEYVAYGVDGQSKEYIFDPVSGTGMKYSAIVKELSEGWHNITVTASCEHLSKGSAFVIFMVDTVSPSVSVLSPQNETYTTPDLPLNFTLSEIADWVGYSLDGQPLAIITGNTTLAGLAEGLHNVTVYANDTVGNEGVSETVYFSIAQETEDEPQPEQEPFPTTLVITASGASLAVVGIGLLVYFKKRNRQRPETGRS